MTEWHDACVGEIEKVCNCDKAEFEPKMNHSPNSEAESRACDAFLCSEKITRLCVQCSAVVWCLGKVDVCGSRGSRMKGEW